MKPCGRSLPSTSRLREIDSVQSWILCPSEPSARGCRRSDVERARFERRGAVGLPAARKVRSVSRVAPPFAALPFGLPPGTGVRTYLRLLRATPPAKETFGLRARQRRLRGHCFRIHRARAEGFGVRRVTRGPEVGSRAARDLIPVTGARAGAWCAGDGPPFRAEIPGAAADMCYLMSLHRPQPGDEKRCSS